MIKATIIGGAGYTAGELIRILLQHPRVTIASIASESQAGKPLSTVHHDLLGTELAFTKRPDLEVEIVFLCLGHGQAKWYLEQHRVPKTTKIIDLSQDFRWQENASFGKRQFIYGLPEVNKEAIKEATGVANPGCFATGIQLGLLPLAAHGWLSKEVVINAITGSTGAGQAPTHHTHFSWRHNNLSTYKVFKHQHLVEIGETLAALQQESPGDLSFIPWRGDFSRGILATLFTRSAKSLQELTTTFKEYYRHQPFTHISDEPIYLKQVVNTNNAIIHLEKDGEKLLITTAIDNLLKGASGQAVQNMNLMFGLGETTGLHLKGSIF